MDWEIFDTQALAATATISSSVIRVRTSGYSAIGDLGGAIYRRGTAEPGSFTSADGAIWVIDQEDLSPQIFGAAGNGMTNDLAAIKNALSLAVTRNVPLLIVRPHRVCMSSATDPIQLSSNTTIIFQGAGSITQCTFGLPLFYALEETNITILNPCIIYDAVATTTLPTVTTTFNNNQGFGPNQGPDRDVIALFLFRGTRGVRLVEPRLTAKTIAYASLIPLGFCFGPGPNSIRPVIDIEGTTFIDGAYFGFLVFGAEHWGAGDIVSDTWSQLDTSVYTWEAPGHVIYYALPNNSALTKDYSFVKLGNLIDKGTPTTDTLPYSGAGSTSFKFTGSPTDITVGNIWSARIAGLMDAGGFNLLAGDIYWDGTCWAGTMDANAYLGANKVIRWNVGDLSVGQRINVGRIKLRMPDSLTINGLIVVALVTESTLDVEITYDGTSVLQWIEGSFWRCYIRLHLLQPNVITTGTPLAVTLQAPSITPDDGWTSSADNRVEIFTDSPQFSIMRVGEAPASGNLTSNNNSARITDIATGSYRELSGHGDGGIGYQTVYVTPPAGPLVTISNIIPKGAVLLGVASVVITSLGTSSGLTEYSVGVSGDTACFGTAGAAATYSTDNSKWANSSGFAFYTAATSLQLTGIGGNFDGTGLICVRIAYFHFSAQYDVH